MIIPLARVNMQTQARDIKTESNLAQDLSVKQHQNVEQKATLRGKFPWPILGQFTFINLVVQRFLSLNDPHQLL